MTKVSVFQYTTITGRFDHNIARMQHELRNAADNGVELCVFPEYFMSGIIRSREEILRAADRAKGGIKQLCDIARECHMQIIPGSYPVLEDGVCYNETCFIDQTGRVVSTHRKRNLWINERDQLSPGFGPIRVFDSVLGKTTMLICWDLMDRRLFEQAVATGSEWIVCVSLWSTNQPKHLRKLRGGPSQPYPGYSDAKLLDALLATRALEYNIGIVFCNVGGHHEYIEDGERDVARSAGRSQVVVPLLRSYGKITSRQEQSLTVDIPDISTTIKDCERFYGRREDVIYTGGC